jgi:hypothetical protein
MAGMISIQFEGNNLIILKNGERKVIDLKIASYKLLEASEAERQLYQISPSGYGVHWPLIDEDLSIEKLLNL